MGPKCSQASDTHFFLHFLLCSLRLFACSFLVAVFTRRIWREQVANFSSFVHTQIRSVSILNIENRTKWRRKLCTISLFLFHISTCQTKTNIKSLKHTNPDTHTPKTKHTPRRRFQLRLLRFRWIDKNVRIAIEANINFTINIIRALQQNPKTQQWWWETIASKATITITSLFLCRLE